MSERINLGAGFSFQLIISQARQRHWENPIFWQWALISRASNSDSCTLGRERYANALSTASSGWNWQERLIPGDPVESILKEAPSWAPDLIVMSTQGHREFLDALRGKHDGKCYAAPNAPCSLYPQRPHSRVKHPALVNSISSQSCTGQQASNDCQATCAPVFEPAMTVTRTAFVSVLTMVTLSTASQAKRMDYFADGEPRHGNADGIYVGAR